MDEYKVEFITIVVFLSLSAFTIAILLGACYPDGFSFEQERTETNEQEHTETKRCDDDLLVLEVDQLTKLERKDFQELFCKEECFVERARAICFYSRYTYDFSRVGCGYAVDFPVYRYSVDFYNGKARKVSVSLHDVGLPFVPNVIKEFGLETRWPDGIGTGFRGAYRYFVWAGLDDYHRVKLVSTEDHLSVGKIEVWIEDFRDVPVHDSHRESENDCEEIYSELLLLGGGVCIDG